MDKLTKDFSADITIEDGERAIVATMTTDAVDRDGEVLIPQGMNSKNFEANPVVMFGHNYFELPVGKVTAVKRGQKKWSAKIIPAERPETYPPEKEWFPDTLYSLFKQGVLNAVSVGLMPQEHRQASTKDIEQYGEGVRRVISKWELLELSICAIPANPEAIATAVGKGLIKSDAAEKIFGKIEVIEEKEVTVEIEEEQEIEETRIHRYISLRPTIKRHAVVATVKTAIQKHRGRIY